MRSEVNSINAATQNGNTCATFPQVTVLQCGEEYLVPQLCAQCGLKHSSSATP